MRPRFEIVLRCLAATCLLASCASLPKVGELYDRGSASWYGPRHHGQKTASGERFDMNALTAAHRTLAFGTRVCVRRLEPARDVTVRINDRGPFARGRVLDLSKAAAAKLGMLNQGEADVEIYLAHCP